MQRTRTNALPYLLIVVATLAITWFAHHAGAAGGLLPWDGPDAGELLVGLAAPPLLLAAILVFLHGGRDARRTGSAARLRTEP